MDTAQTPRGRTRQQHITREQVLCKRDDAHRRCLGALEECLKATSAVEYDEALARGVRAARDYETWSMVLLAV